MGSGGEGSGGGFGSSRPECAVEGCGCLARDTGCYGWCGKSDGRLFDLGRLGLTSGRLPRTELDVEQRARHNGEPVAARALGPFCEDSEVWTRRPCGRGGPINRSGETVRLYFEQGWSDTRLALEERSDTEKRSGRHRRHAVRARAAQQHFEIRHAGHSSALSPPAMKGCVLRSSSTSFH